VSEYERAGRDEKAFRSDLAYGGPVKAEATADEKACYVLARYACQNDHYRGLYQQWTKPIFFLVGKHHLNWEAQRGTFVPDTDVPPWRQQPVTNWTYAVYRTLLAKLTKQRPTTEVVPPSGDSEDREAANLAESVLEHLWRLLRCPQKMQLAVGWLLATGNVGLEVGWDPEAGERVPRTVLVEIANPDVPGQTIDIDCACDEMGEPYRHEDEAKIAQLGPALDGGAPYDLERTPELDATGEVTFEVVDPLSYRFDTDATSVDDAREFFKARMWPLEAICARFGVEPKDIKVGNAAGEDRQALDDVLSSVTAGAPDPFDAKYTATAGTRGEGERADKALVIEYFAKPDDDHPEGRYWITAAGSKVWPKDAEEAPLPHGFWPPIVPVTDCPIPGQPQGLGVLSQVVPLNEKYNYLDAKIMEYHVTMAMGGVWWVHPDDKGIRITSEPGQVKPSKGLAHGHPPIRDQLQALPAPVYTERDIVRDTIQAIAATSQLDLGQRPEGVSAGRAFLVIQEASDAAIGPTLQAIENAIEESGRRKLVVVRQHYTDERTIKIRGERGQWEFRSFAGADLRDGLDVRVQAGSSFPFSKSAQLDTKLGVLERMPWVVNNPTTGAPDAARFSKFLDVAGTGLQSFETSEDDHLLEINREHAMFEEYDPQDPQKSNELPQLAVWQDQIRHLQEHYAFMRRSFNRFQRWSDAAKLAFMDHMRLTQEAVEKQLARVMPAPTGTEAGGAPGGAPSEPTPTADAGAPAGRGNLRLTKGDRASAGQTAATAAS
jgi:hypothetical protein